MSLSSGKYARRLQGTTTEWGRILLRDDPDVLAALAAHWDGYDTLNRDQNQLDDRVAAVLSDTLIWGENLDAREGLRAALVREIGLLEGEGK